MVGREPLTDIKDAFSKRSRYVWMGPETVPLNVPQESSKGNLRICNTLESLKAVCHVTDWPLQSELNNNGFLCESVYLKQRRANLLDFLRS